ncbi:MAG: glycosyltransferase [Pseudomonadota bacterium]
MMDNVLNRYDYTLDFSNENSSHVKALQMVGRERRVLEIGCATGYLSRYLTEELGCRVIGVEIDADAAEKANNYCEEVIVGDIESLALEEMFEGREFDVIMMTDVIEHLKNARRMLHRLKSNLSASGFLILSIPNGAHGSVGLELLDGKWDYRKEGLLDQTHLHFYDKDSLSLLLEEAGFFISQLDRVIIHPRDTEMKTPWESYPREVTAYLEKVNPEYRTYQFVVKAYPMSDTGWRGGLENAIAAGKKKIEKLEAIEAENEKELGYLRGEYNGFQNELKKRETEYLANLEKELSLREREKQEIHAGYKNELSRQETERQATVGGYEKEIHLLTEAAKREATEIHAGYQSRVAALAEEIKEIHHGYRKELDRRDRVWKEKLNRKEKHIQTLVDRETQLGNTLDEIYRSRAWQLLAGYRRTIDTYLPPNTRRRRLYHLSVLAPIVLWNEGLASFFNKIGRRLFFFRKKAPVESPMVEETPFREPIGFPAFQSIQVSIIIPVYNHYHHTYRCLRSLRENTTTPFEVIIVDNASEDGTADHLNRVSGITVIRNDRNYGFVEACNRGADAAGGDFLLFLNNDTEVTAGWLEAMLRAFENTLAGVVGAKLVYPDGSLQEAGNIIWQNGTGWNYGRGDNPDLPQYNYMKAVDYCSGACLMIPRTLWKDVGGFDLRFAPAYYEDTDLCFSVRDKGFTVVYQPEATVIHYEGATAGRDIHQGMKQYQQKNHAAFLNKWRGVLGKDHASGPEQLYLARERGATKRALVVDHYIPTYDKDSGSLRMFSLLKILVEMGYKVVFWPENRAYDRPYALALQRLGIEVIYGNVDFDEYLLEYGGYFDLALLSRPHVAINFIHSVKAYTNAKIIYDTVDLHYLRETRRAGIEADPERRREAGELAAAWKQKELFLANEADVTLVVSPAEKTLLENETAFNGKVSVVSNVHTIEARGNGFEEREGLMFIAGFDHTPNEDAVMWFVEAIFPDLQKRIPNLRFTIVGSNPSERVRALASESITVTGYLADVSPFFRNAKVFVSPLRYGAGVKGKVGQSMAHGLPVVTTSMGAEGMGLIDGVNALITDDADEFCRKVEALYNDKALWEKISDNGLRVIEKHFSPDVIKEKFHLACSGGVCV